ncbi:hypothetical protein TNCV_4667281 [Trichonephila clavipes]|nr:hypothetical protein TNCV_4667281 [Trichonephila clavipes]
MNSGHGYWNGTTLCLSTKSPFACNVTMVGFQFGDIVDDTETFPVLTLEKVKKAYEDAIAKALYKARVSTKYRVMTRVICRNAYQKVSEFDRGSYRESYHSVISAFALVEIQPLSCNSGINGLLTFLLKGMQDLHALLLTPERTDIL